MKASAHCRPQWTRQRAADRILQELAVCRTPALGFYRWMCEKCGQAREICNPCRGRHCPLCLAHLSGVWAAARKLDAYQP